MNESNKAVRHTNDLRSGACGSVEAESVQAVERALAIFELPRRTGAAVTGRRVAAGSGVNHTTARRRQASRRSRGWSERVDGAAAHRPGSRYRALVRASLADRDVIAEVNPTLEQRSCRSRGTVHRGILDSHDSLQSAEIDSLEIVEVSSRVGTRAAPHWIRPGMASLVSRSNEEWEAYVEHGQTRLVPRAALDAASHPLIAPARRRYHSDDRASSPGARRRAAAIRGVAGSPLVTIGLTGPSERFTREREVPCVREMLAVALQLTVRCGGDVSARLEAVA